METTPGKMTSSEFSMSNYVSRLPPYLGVLIAERPFFQQLGEPLGKGASAQVYSTSLTVLRLSLALDME